MFLQALHGDILRWAEISCMSSPPRPILSQWHSLIQRERWKQIVTKWEQALEPSVLFVQVTEGVESAKFSRLKLKPRLKRWNSQSHVCSANLGRLVVLVGWRFPAVLGWVQGLENGRGMPTMKQDEGAFEGYTNANHETTIHPTWPVSLNWRIVWLMDCRQNGDQAWFNNGPSGLPISTRPNKSA